MYIQDIKLKGFRNFEELTMSFSKGLNVFFGDNAQGKTNLLESMFICSSGRSHKTSRDSEIIKNSGSSYYIRLSVEKKDTSPAIEIYYDEILKKKISINEIQAKKIGALMGNLITVMFSPEDIQVIKEGPSLRRRFIDIAISQIRPSYFYNLQQYSKIIVERNALLRQPNISHDMLDIWNSQLVSVGTTIMNIRREFVDKLDKALEMRHSSLCGNKENVKIIYRPSFQGDFQSSLKRSFNSELMKKTTIIGPHRDDYEILLNGESLKTYGSQGQIRTAVLSMKLAQIDIIKNEVGENPVLLLDDVLSELDQKRQSYLLENVKEMQTFITCTGLEFFENMEKKDAKFIEIISGTAHEIYQK